MSAELADSFGLESTRGALIAEVVEGSPADKAGIRRGDILLSFDGKEIEHMRELPRIVASTDVGSTVKAELFRDGKTISVNVTVGELEEEIAGLPTKVDKGVHGLGLSNITPELQKSLELESKRGVVITSITPDTPASRSDLRRGDLILEVNGLEIEDVVNEKSGALMGPRSVTIASPMPSAADSTGSGCPPATGRSATTRVRFGSGRTCASGDACRGSKFRAGRPGKASPCLQYIP